MSNPKHGFTERVNGEEAAYRYIPNSGYFGEDVVTALVDAGEVQVEVVQRFKVVNSITSGGTGLQVRHCGRKSIYRKIR
jgi:hypothetical protein